MPINYLTDKSWLHVLIGACVMVTIVTGWTTGATGGGIYVCKGSNGGMHFTNTPTSSDCKIYSNKKTSPFAGSNARSARYSKKLSKGYSGNIPYNAQINQIGNRYRVDPNLIKAVIRAESSFNRYAVSRTGAQGLMQLMPATARELKVADPFNPHQNIDGGTRYLRSLFDTFDGNLTLTLAAYNAGPTLVKKVNRIPRIPETVTYVKRVLTHYKGYSKAQPLSSAATIRVHDVVTIQ